MIGCMFNIDGGYLEGLCRGFKCGILKQSDYLNLVQCETLEGEKVVANIIIDICFCCSCMLNSNVHFQLQI
jgi:hypothetical protein